MPKTLQLNSSAVTSIHQVFHTPISRESALTRIKEDAETYRVFLSFSIEYQEQLLAFIEEMRD